MNINNHHNLHLHTALNLCDWENYFTLSQRSFCQTALTPPCTQVWVGLIKVGSHHVAFQIRTLTELLFTNRTFKFSLLEMDIFIVSVHVASKQTSAAQFTTPPLAVLQHEMQTVRGSQKGEFDGLMQERSNSSALAMELRLSCTNPLNWSHLGWGNPQLTLFLKSQSYYLMRIMKYFNLLYITDVTSNKWCETT